MEIIRSPAEMQAWSQTQRRAGKRVGVVPTMGFLHEGHLSLVRIAKQHADVVILTLFVNPTQFGPNEDLDRYPRDFERDRALCEAEGVDVLFAPCKEEIYAPDHSIRVEEDVLSGGLCGASRPAHFGGVLLVVAKLFNLTLPDVAVFGEKDAQQIRLIRRLVRDLDFPIEIVGGPIVREADGLAMSSRNKNLNPESRALAHRLYAALQTAAAAYEAGQRNAQILKQQVNSALAYLGSGCIDYVEVVDDETLAPVEGESDRPLLIAIAVRFPGVRLIDNIVLGSKRNR